MNQNQLKKPVTNNVPQNEIASKVIINNNNNKNTVPGFSNDSVKKNGNEPLVSTLGKDVNPKTNSTPTLPKVEGENQSVSSTAILWRVLACGLYLAMEQKTTPPQPSPQGGREAKGFFCLPLLWRIPI